jgi:polar amino acid transport system permease protein
MTFTAALIQYAPDLLHGLIITLELTFISAILGFIMGVPLVLAILYGKGLIKFIANLYVTLVRGTPLLVQLFFIYYGLPGIGINPSPLMAAIIGFVFNSAAYQAEYMKGGFLSITTEQMEAAYSIGMTKWQAIILVIFPQAFRFSIPSLSNEMIYLIKYTSIAYMVQVPELFAQAKFFASDTFFYLRIFLVIGLIYLILVFFVTKLTSILEKKLLVPGFDFSHIK